MVAQACNLNTQEAEGGGLVGSWSQAWTTGEVLSQNTVYTQSDTSDSRPVCWLLSSQAEERVERHSFSSRSISGRWRLDDCPWPQDTLASLGNA